MNAINFNDLPLIASFNDFKSEDTVFSIKYGLGKVARVYKDELIVDFGGHRQRFGVDDKELRAIPEYLRTKQKSKIEVFENGEKISYRKYKQEIAVKKATQIEESVTLTQAADILGLSKKELIKKLDEYKIEINIFDGSKTINRLDLLRLRQ